jgi:hypothetical protein
MADTCTPWQRGDRHAVSIHFMLCDFARAHSSLSSNSTRGLAGWVADHVWTVYAIDTRLD